MNILEQVKGDSFLGHWGCRILINGLIDSDDNSPYHIKGDVLRILDGGGIVPKWDLMISTPPLCYLCVSGARWMNHPKYPNRAQDSFIALPLLEGVDGNSHQTKSHRKTPLGVLSTRLKESPIKLSTLGCLEMMRPKPLACGLKKKICLILFPTNPDHPPKKMTKSGKAYDSWWLMTSSIPYWKDGLKKGSGLKHLKVSQKAMAHNGESMKLQLKHSFGSVLVKGYKRVYDHPSV